jgi:hypothetical protein
MSASRQTASGWPSRLPAAAAGTDGAANPFWSPDSRFVAFVAVGRLKKVEVGGGLSVTLSQVTAGTGGTQNRDGGILFTVLGVAQIQRVPASGGMPASVTSASADQGLIAPVGGPRDPMPDSE